MKFATLFLTLFAFAACASDGTPDSRPMTARYSQPELLRNWALSACLATVAKDAADRNDANATASAYLEFGEQPIEAYEALMALVNTYASRRYSGSVPSEFNTMKCIDLYHSEALGRLVAKLVAPPQ